MNDRYRVEIVFPPLRAKNCWPDGDGPEQPTAEDVARRIEESGTLAHWIDSWNMSYQAHVTVNGVTVRLR